MQVATYLRRMASGRIVFTILVAAQMVQPARVVAQEFDFANEAQKMINDVRSRVPNCNVLQGGEGFKVQIASSNAKPRPAVAWNTKLAFIAQGHAAAMAKESFFDHVDMAGKNVAIRAKDAGYRYRVVSENIAAGQESMPEVVMEWIASKGHCENLIDDRVTEFGLAKVQSTNPLDPYSVYWTLVMGTPQR